MSPAQDEQAPTDAVTFKSLFSFNGTNGYGPEQNLVQGRDGNLSSACFGTPGVVFKLTPNGAEKTIYDFGSQPSCADGANPEQQGTLALATDGHLYGTAGFGGTYGAAGGGTILEVARGGMLTTLYSFCGYLQRTVLPWALRTAGLSGATMGTSTA